MSKTDWKAILIVGAGVGLLIQPILANNVPPHYLSFGFRAGVFVFFTLFAPFALWIARQLAKLWAGIYQFAQFAAVGTLNTFIDIGVFNVEIFLHGTGGMLGNGIFAAFKAISFLFATTNSFVWNKFWTFNAKEKVHGGELTAFYSIALIGWALNVGGATLAKTLGPADSRVWVSILAPLVGVAASFLWDFFGYKHFVFKKPTAPTLDNKA